MQVEQCVCMRERERERGVSIGNASRVRDHSVGLASVACDDDKRGDLWFVRVNPESARRQLGNSVFFV